MKTALECTIWRIHLENFVGEDPQAPLPNRKRKQFSVSIRQSSIYWVGQKPCKLDTKKKQIEGIKIPSESIDLGAKISKFSWGCKAPNPPTGASRL